MRKCVPPRGTHVHFAFLLIAAGPPAPSNCIFAPDCRVAAIFPHRPCFPYPGFPGSTGSHHEQIRRCGVLQCLYRPGVRRLGRPEGQELDEGRESPSLIARDPASTWSCRRCPWTADWSHWFPTTMTRVMRQRLIPPSGQTKREHKKRGPPKRASPSIKSMTGRYFAAGAEEVEQPSSSSR